MNTDLNELAKVIKTFNSFINKKIMTEEQVSIVLEKYNTIFIKKGEGYVSIICQNEEEKEDE